ncbi:putative intracellular survival FAD-dependent oxidoreductase IbeA [Escherichia coli]|nr:putative intracellular survival FAD-dependent oxidoreductase IbeA [Escherichia coli]EFJ9806001.1 putative intracellular survival FAD-dependent oxidoreductase IbeA [Escherichia coli]EJY9900701.1 putative intracellular survival FAD-dependent oxidoreductase IbeA [Escherichia coli]EJZ9812282.1 putative intracellular survival FAD-dependent oxidoreductase IbeA [Escherichia coli]EKG3682006.1 putative intracellular survival FAD-dependent oxidoreductase IbeA [Escherichia coli]
MEFYLEPARNIPVLTTTEVLVVGGGPSGIAAAMSAAREGAATMLIERFGCFGGMMTTAGVESIAWWRHENTVESGGLAREIEETAKSMGASSPEPQSNSQAINAERFKLVADAMLEQAGVRRVLHITAVDVIKQGNNLLGVITESKSGRQAILANINKNAFMQNIKSTEPKYGDWGADEENKNWSYDVHESCRDMFSPYLGKVFAKGKSAGIIPKDVTLGGSWSTVTEYDDANYLNVVSIPAVDCTDVFDLTRAEIEGRKQAMQAIEALRQFQPGFEQAQLKNFGMTVGTRESRHIIGRVQLTENDICNEGRHADSIGVFPEFIDGNGHLKLPLEANYFQIPYGVMIPQQVENLLVCGRAIDADNFAYATIRNMGCCIVTGEGAGTAAAIAIKNNTTVSQVDIQTVQERLQQNGVKVF